MINFLLIVCFMVMAFLWGWISVARAVQRSSSADEFVRSCLRSVYAWTLITIACWWWLPPASLIVEMVTMKFSAMLLLSWEKIYNRYHKIKQ